MFETTCTHSHTRFEGVAIVPGHNLCAPAGFFPVPMTTQHGQSVSNGSFVPVTVHGYPGEPRLT